MMVRSAYILLIYILSISVIMGQHAAIGTWVTKDDKTGEEKSLVEIYQEDGKYYGKIIKLLLPVPSDICTKCKGEKKDLPLMGLTVIENMKDDGKRLSGGTITDPKTGKVYKCKITLQGNDQLKLRGYIGIEALGRNQIWTRKK